MAFNNRTRLTVIPLVVLAGASFSEEKIGLPSFEVGKLATPSTIKEQEAVEEEELGAMLELLAIIYSADSGYFKGYYSS